MIDWECGSLQADDESPSSFSFSVFVSASLHALYEVFLTASTDIENVD